MTDTNSPAPMPKPTSSSTRCSSARRPRPVRNAMSTPAASISGCPSWTAVTAGVVAELFVVPVMTGSLLGPDGRVAR